MAQVKTSVVFDPETLFEIDTYLLELKLKGIPTDRSAFLNVAALEKIQRERAEEEGE